IRGGVKGQNLNVFKADGNPEKPLKNKGDRLNWKTSPRTQPKLKGIMPLLKLETTAALSDEKKAALLMSLSKIVADTISKPEQYVMVMAETAAITMAGKPGESAFVDLRSIGGLSGAVNRQLSQKICHLLNEKLGVPQDRIYLNFTDVAA